MRSRINIEREHIRLAKDGTIDNRLATETLILEVLLDIRTLLINKFTP